MMMDFPASQAPTFASIAVESRIPVSAVIDQLTNTDTAAFAHGARGRFGQRQSGDAIAMID